MSDLIEALIIFLKYDDPSDPTMCSDGDLIVNIDPKLVSDDDKNRLEALGFWASCDGNFFSGRFGSR